MPAEINNYLFSQPNIDDDFSFIQDTNKTTPVLGERYPPVLTPY